jgi:molybdopterin-containing oxidoreductase family iron-sulfur binding subunit
VTIHLSQYDDETSKLCTWHLPQAHGLESWGDGRAWDGTLTLRQPLITPLYDGRSTIEVLALASGAEATSGYELVRENLDAQSRTADFEGFWRRALHDGVVEGTAWETVSSRLNPGRLAVAVDKLRALLDVAPPSADRPEVVLIADSKVWDGRFANNGWLQELPDALTKVTWDNALLISPATARELGIADGEITAIEAGGTSIEAPTFVFPGQARSSVTLALGYGRTAAGQVGDGVGVNAYPLRTSGSPHIVASATVRGTGRRYSLATTQDHFAIDTIGFRERNRRVGDLVRETSLDAYLADPEIFHAHEHHPPLISLWKDREYEGEQWGMAIDLNTCIGCNACVVACQAENNIPVVGREQVLNQREMHWIRIDRYFKTDANVAPEELDSAEVVFQPMTCVHCENAPCEQVCPVAATQHTTDGLNAMVYNRCVGTRYCSNNCPFKVRRFNFFNYHKDLADARNDNRPIADGEIVPACAQTCPAQAITFGNLNDPNSSVSRLREEKRSYATLAELNIRPRAHYLGRLSNRADGGGPVSHGAPHGEADSHGKETA